MAAPVDANAASPIADTQPRLSPEICERIIDHLHPIWHENKRQTLLNCALVCRGWYAESRAVLFEEPRLHTRKGALLCVKSLKQIPLLAAHVQHLVIGHYSDPEATMAGPELVSILVMLAGKLPKLASLDLISVSFEHCSMQHLTFWSLHELSHITSLSLDSVMLPAENAFFQVICSSPRLQTLSCYNLHWSERRSMVPLPERHRMPLRTVTALHYDLSCIDHIGHVLLRLLAQSILKTLDLDPQASAATLGFTQDILNVAGRRLEEAEIVFWAPEEDAGGNFQSWFLHPISFEANVNMQELELHIVISEMNDVAMFVRSMLPFLFDTISSKDLKGICFGIQCNSRLETDALLNAFDQQACIQIDELLAEGHFPRLRDVLIDFHLYLTELDDSQHVGFCTEICARFPKLNDKNMLITDYNGYQFPSDAERALKTKQLADKQPCPNEQAAA